MKILRENLSGKGSYRLNLTSRFHLTLKLVLVLGYRVVSFLISTCVVKDHEEMYAYEINQHK